MTSARVTLLIGLLCAIPYFAQRTTESSTPVSSRPQTSLNVDVNLVLLNTTVTDPHNRHIPGLTKEQFHIWEDKVEQEIQYFSSESAPLSVGIIFDSSGSMQDKLPAARAAANTFLKTGERDDEYFLVEFSNAPALVTDFTNDISKLQNRLLVTRAQGTTSLYDALYLGLDKVGRGNNARKALLLISDGDDNHSHYSFSNLKDFAKEHDAQIYAIGIVDESGGQSTAYSSRGRLLLEDLADVTGGRAFFPHSLNELESICAQIALDLKNQYVIGYRPLNPTNDGRWRKVKVRVDKANGMPRLNVRARAGYYAPRLQRS